MYLCSFVFLCTFSQLFAQTPIIVNITRGSVLGYHISYGSDGQGDMFFGIPFAIPPVGPLRYKQPRPITQFPGPSPYNATYYRKECVQPSSNNNLSTMSEDCLYVNIMSPNISSTIKYPVMIWIHGGGLKGGSGNLGNGGSILRNYGTKGIIFSSLQYRLGWLGFFTTHTNDFPPNLGMLDQVLALKFLKEEISYFGGDPNRITIFGQSAGGHSVSSHTYSPLSQNLFQQAIMESGTVYTCYEDLYGPTKLNFQMAEKACNYTQEMWDSGDFTALKNCLMNISVEDGLKAADKVEAGNAVCWNMVQDNYFLPSPPQILAQTRPNIPVIIGNCKDESAYGYIPLIKNGYMNLTYFNRKHSEDGFLYMCTLLYQFKPWFGNGTQAQEVLKIVEDNYLPPGTKDNDSYTWLQFDVDFQTAAFFTMGSLRDIEAYLTNKNPNVYAYQFSWSSSINDEGNNLTNWHPAPHVCEIGYVFGIPYKWNETDTEIANLIQEHWANFIIHGKPTLNDSWTSATSTNYTTLEYFEYYNISTQKVGFRYKDQIVFNQDIPKILGQNPPSVPDTHTLCPKGYQSKVKNTTCYEAFGTPLNWNDAQNFCVQNSYGALATIGSAFENSDLLAYAKNAFPTCSGFYTGLFRSTFIANNANWTWTNYDPTGYRNWNGGSPKQDSNSNCVVLNRNDGTWTNQNCDISQCFVCSY